MAWHRAGIKPLSEPMMAYVTDAYMCHSAWMNSHVKPSFTRLQSKFSGNVAESQFTAL